MIKKLLIALLLCSTAFAVVTTEVTEARYDGDGADKTFDFAFGIYNTSDLVVQLINETTGDPNTQTETSEYVVSAVNNNYWKSSPGGTVTFVTAPTTNHEVYIFRDPNTIQSLNLKKYSQMSSVNPKTLEDVLNQIVTQNQNSDRVDTTSLKFPPNEGNLTTILPNAIDRASSFLVFDANGEPSTSSSEGFAVLSDNETITGNWVNTAFPWADNEVADDITAGTATTLETPRAIGGVNFDGSAAITPTTIAVTDTTDTTSFFGFWESATGNLLPQSDGGATYNAGTGMATFTGVTAPLTGNSSTATILATARAIGGVNFDGSAAITPTTIAVTDTTDATSFFGFWEAATGNLLPQTDLGATYNAGTGMATFTGITGPLTGNVTGDVSGTAGVATLVTITDNESTNEENSLVFVAGADPDGGNLGLETDGTATYNPSTGVITTTGFAGALTGNVTGNADTVTTNANLTGEVTSVGNAATIADSIAVTNWNLTTPTITTHLTITAQANPTTDGDGELANDTDGWNTGYDALEFFNGTASAYLVATTASDTPANGEFPMFNTNGTITWETAPGAAGGDAWSDDVDSDILPNVGSDNTFDLGSEAASFKDGWFDGDLTVGGTINGGGDVFKVGTPANTEIGFWTGDGTLSRDPDLAWDSNALAVISNSVAAGITVTSEDGTSAVGIGSARIQMTGSGININLLLDSKGTGDVDLFSDSTGNLVITGASSHGTNAIFNIVQGNGTAPGTNPADMTHMYVLVGELWAEDSGGTATQLTANTDDFPSDMAFDPNFPYVTLKQNKYAGVKTYVSEHKMAQLVQELSRQAGLIGQDEYLIKHVALDPNDTRDWNDNETWNEAIADAKIADWEADPNSQGPKPKKHIKRPKKNWYK